MTIVQRTNNRNNNPYRRQIERIGVSLTHSLCKHRAVVIARGCRTADPVCMYDRFENREKTLHRYCTLARLINHRERSAVAISGRPCARHRLASPRLSPCESKLHAGPRENAGWDRRAARRRNPYFVLRDPRMNHFTCRIRWRAV